jgi:hypothetical protein
MRSSCCAAVHDVPGEGSSLARHPDNLRMTDAAELVAIDVFKSFRLLQIRTSAHSWFGK